MVAAKYSVLFGQLILIEITGKIFFRENKNKQGRKFTVRIEYQAIRFAIHPARQARGV